MSQFKRRSLLVADTCPVCRRRYEDVSRKPVCPRQLSLSLSNDYFELSFTGTVCEECYCKLAGTRQQSLFDAVGHTLTGDIETRQQERSHHEQTKEKVHHAEETTYLP